MYRSTASLFHLPIALISSREAPAEAIDEAPPALKLMAL